MSKRIAGQTMKRLAVVDKATDTGPVAKKSRVDSSPPSSQSSSLATALKQDGVATPTSPFGQMVAPTSPPTSQAAANQLASLEKTDPPAGYKASDVPVARTKVGNTHVHVGPEKTMKEEAAANGAHRFSLISTKPSGEANLSQAKLDVNKDILSESARKRTAHAKKIDGLVEELNTTIGNKTQNVCIHCKSGRERAPTLLAAHQYKYTDKPAGRPVDTSIQSVSQLLDDSGVQRGDANKEAMTNMTRNYAAELDAERL